VTITFVGGLIFNFVQCFFTSLLNKIQNKEKEALTFYYINVILIIIYESVPFTQWHKKNGDQKKKINNKYFGNK